MENKPNDSTGQPQLNNTQPTKPPTINLNETLPMESVSESESHKSDNNQ